MAFSAVRKGNSRDGEWAHTYPRRAGLFTNYRTWWLDTRVPPGSRRAIKEPLQEQTREEDLRSKASTKAPWLLP